MKKLKSIRWDRNIANAFFGICVLALILYIVVGFNMRSHDYTEDRNEIYDSNFTWLLEKTDKTTENVILPYSPKIEAGKTAVIKTTLPDNIEDNMVITLRPDQLDMTVFVDGVERCSYSTKDTRFMGTLSCRRYIFMRLYDDDAGKEMDVYLHATVSDYGRFETLKYGEKSEILIDMLHENISDVAVGIIMFIVSILCLVFGVVLSVGLKTEIELNFLSMMSILASVWIMCNSEISQLYFPNGSLSSNVDYMCLMLMPFPFLLYVDAVQKGRFFKVFRIFEIMTILEIVVCMSLALSGIFDLSQMFMVYSIVLGSTLIMIMISVLIDVFKYKNHTYVIIVIGIFAAVFSTLLQIVMYATGSYKFGGNAVGIALLVMLGAAIFDTMQKVKNVQMEKQVAIAERKAESGFLANMSHEIRTPINAVLGMNEMILRESSEKNILEYAENIGRSGNMLLTIVNDILDFSKINSGKMGVIEQNYSLKGIVNDVCGMMLQRAMDKGLKFNVDITPSAANDLCGDDVRIKQIMVNLLNNAIKYTDKGFVALRVFTVDIDETRVNLNISISDSGRGIPEEDQEKLFDAFSRADEKNNRAIEGTGLGLALVKQLAVIMGGSVGVNSTYGEGSTFSVTIPQNKVGNRKVRDIVEDKAAEKEGKNSGEEKVFTAPDAHILAVDDTPMNLTVMKGLLKRTKVQLETANSGVMAIECLKNNKFDLILMDHLMPGMDGVETFRKIRDEHIADGTPIIILTANAIAGSREKYLEAGFDEYLSKPVKAPELEEMLARFLTKS